MPLAPVWKNGEHLTQDASVPPGYKPHVRQKKKKTPPKTPSQLSLQPAPRESRVAFYHLQSALSEVLCGRVCGPVQLRLPLLDICSFEVELDCLEHKQ